MLKKHFILIVAIPLFIVFITIILPYIYLLKCIRPKKRKKIINILFIIATLNVGGTEVQLKNLLKYLDKNKFNPYLCVLTEIGPLKKEIKKFNIPIFVLGKKTKFNFMLVFDIAKIIRKHHINIVHTSLFASNFWGRLGALLGNAPIIIASERSASKEKYFRIYDRILAFFTDKIICNSEAVKKFQIEKEKINPKKLKIIYNGVDLEKFDDNLSRAKENKSSYRHKLGIQDNEFVIGNVCRITPEKDLLTWLKTAKILLAKNKQLRFIIVGDAVSTIGEETSYKKQIADLINKLDIKNNVIMTGFSDDVTKEFAIMNLFYQSSVIEGFPNAVLEAMTTGLPVVATPAGGTREVLTDNENGIITDSNPENAAKQILELINNPEKAKILGQNARLTIKNNFSGEQLARNTEKLYEQLLSEQRF